MVRRELGTPREFASSDVTIVVTVSDYTSASASGATEGCCGHAVASGHVIEFVNGKFVGVSVSFGHCKSPSVSDELDRSSGFIL